MPPIRTIATTILTTLLVLSLVALGTAFGVGTAGANHPDDAPDMTEYVDFEVNFPHATDHYPGDVNEENGSIEYFASGAEAFAEQDAEEGVFVDWIIVHAEYDDTDWIDYSACDTGNTEAFGIDRGNNNEGTQYDEDLVSRQKRVGFEDNGIIIDFYEWEDFSNDPPYLAPEDAVVAAQGAGSSDGPCLTLTDEPGWYRIAAFMNATVADNGPDEPPSEDADRVSLELHSNYLYVCECDSEQEAREQLGDPPDEGSDPTPTETDDGGEDQGTPTPTATDTGEDPTPTPTAEGTEATSTGTEDDTGVTSTEDGGGQADGDHTDDVQGTPTPGDGPGFGPVVALVALLAAALLAYRRD